MTYTPKYPVEYIRMDVLVDTPVESTPRAVTYCSFAAEKNLGVCILTGTMDPVQASIAAGALNINPGGELMAIVCTETDEDLPRGLFEVMWGNRDRLIELDEARTLFDAVTLRELEEEEND